MSLDRIVPFTGVLNFRDLGGYRTLDGRTTRWGRLFRSDAMHDLTLDDLAIFRRLGVSSVVDLRSSVEVARTGRGLLELESIRFVNFPVLSEAEAPREELTFGAGYLVQRYLQYLKMGAPAFVAAIEEMSIPDNYPLVFNCFFGKDRTGVLAALILSCLEVELATIVQDYATTDGRVRFIMEKLRRDPTLRDTVDQTDPALLAASEATMSNFLHEVDQRFGGARAWFGAVGVSSDQLKRIEEIVLE